MNNKDKINDVIYEISQLMEEIKKALERIIRLLG
tara:strand:- start:374 stop:475 length:102 start_codon:yes stop_codon:yes gene_type:complete